MSSSLSIPTTLPAADSRARSRRATAPVPQAMSSTRSPPPGRMSDSSSSAHGSNTAGTMWRW
jgi:hypothetical protein